MTAAPSAPSLAQLRAFLAVTAAGGFSEAAAELGVSQSSLSEHVTKLERLLHRALFRRTPSGTLLTEVGERVLASARAAVQAAGDVLLAAQEDTGLSGALRVASYRSTATHLLPPALARFRVAHPGAEVALLDSESESCGGGAQAVRRGVVDVAIITDSAPDLRLTPLLEDEYVFVAPQSRGRHPARLAELLTQPFLLPPCRDTCHQRVRRYLEVQGISLSEVVEIGQDSVLLSMVEHGLGLTIMPRLALRPLSAGLLALPLPERLLRPLALATLPHRANLPIIRAFTAVLLASLDVGAAAPNRETALPDDPMLAAAPVQ